MHIFQKKTAIIFHHLLNLRNKSSSTTFTSDHVRNTLREMFKVERDKVAVSSQHVFLQVFEVLQNKCFILHQSNMLAYFMTVFRLTTIEAPVQGNSDKGAHASPQYMIPFETSRSTNAYFTRTAILGNMTKCAFNPDTVGQDHPFARTRTTIPSRAHQQHKTY